MITKLVTQDLYGNTHIYRNQVHTASETVKGKCKICGKTIKKTISFQYTDKPTEDDYKWLEEKKQEWLGQEHICNKCFKDNLVTGGNVLEDVLIAPLQKFQDLDNQYTEIRKIAQVVSDDLQDKIEGKVARYEDKEFVISYVDYHFSNSNSMSVYAYRVNKNKPWETVEDQWHFDNIPIDEETTWHHSLDKLQITDEVFSTRWDKICKWEEENE